MSKASEFLLADAVYLETHSRVSYQVAKECHVTAVIWEFVPCPRTLQN